MTQLCVPLTAASVTDMIDEIRIAARAGADMIELRVDFVRDLTADGMRALIEASRRFDGSVLVTCRREEEGGHYTGQETDRLKLLQVAAQGGADYVDVEYEAFMHSSELREGLRAICSDRTGPANTGLILSKHDFYRTPENLSTLLDTMARESCDVVKIACQAETITDSLRMLDALKDSAARRPTIALSMGETGILTRVLARKFGALLTFASLESGKESAPGQVSLADMCDLYRWGSIGEQTDVYGVIGCPVAHSMSPAILNTAFTVVGYDAVYLPMRVEPPYECFADFIDGCISRPWFGLGGCSVTIPHKQNLLRYVSERGGHIEELARRIGAANTLHVSQSSASDDPDALLAAYNTDYRGAMDALCDGIGCDPSSLGQYSIAVLGAGGVSRAIVAGLRDAGCPVVIYNRTRARAESLANEFGATVRPIEARTDHGAQVVVNGTSIGMWPNVNDTPLPAEGLSGHPVVFDTVYNPLETRLLCEAREQGCKTVDGVAMFVNQAAAQFERWTGQQAPVDAMRDIVLARLSG